MIPLAIYTPKLLARGQGLPLGPLRNARGGGGALYRGSEEVHGAISTGGAPKMAG
jgi:hypothetical protein